MITFTVPTVPVPVSAYGDTLLHEFPRAAITVLPWMAAVTVFVIGVGLIRRWLGARTAFMEESSKMRALQDGPIDYYGKGEDRVAVYRHGDKLYTSKDYE